MTSGRPLVLIVDEDQFWRCAVSAALLASDYSIVASRSVGDVSACLALHPIDIAFVDVMLPEANGARTIRDISRILPETLIVMMVEAALYAAPEAARLAAALAVDGMLQKPFDTRKAVRLARRLWSCGQSAAHSAARRDRLSARELSSRVQDRSGVVQAACRSFRSDTECGQTSPVEPRAKAAWLKNLSDDELDNWIKAADQQSPRGTAQ